MSTEKQEPEKIDLPAEPPKPEVMGIVRDDKNARVSFTPDGAVLIITMPIAHMPRVMAHGFLWELHEMVNGWYAERKKNKIIVRDEVSKFNFKQSVSKLFGK